MYPEADLRFTSLHIERKEDVVKYLLLLCPEDPWNRENKWSYRELGMFLLLYSWEA